MVKPIPPRDPGDKGRFLGDVLSFGWVLPASTATGAGLGWLLDRWLGFFPVVTILLGLLGAAAGLFQVYRESTRLAEGPGREDGKGK